MPVARVQAQAKVNLFLRVMDRRPDGFHDLVTMFQLVDLADDIVIRLGGAGRTLHVAGPRLPSDGLGPVEKNLAYRAALAYADRAKWPGGFSIELTKNIPTGGGLGGGSSDAGAVLRALNAMSERPLSREALVEIAASLGSDVAFFVTGSSRAIGAGRGEDLADLEPLPARDVILGVPSFAVATSDAFRWLDEDRADATSRSRGGSAGALPDLDSWDVISRFAFNDFEEPVERRLPALGELRSSLGAQGASVARLSGSGSTVFGVFDGLAPLPEGQGGVTWVRTRTSTRVVPVETRE